MKLFGPEYSFDEYFQLGSRRNIWPIKNGLYTHTHMHMHTDTCTHAHTHTHTHTHTPVRVWVASWHAVFLIDFVQNVPVPIAGLHVLSILAVTSLCVVVVLWNKQVASQYLTLPSSWKIKSLSFLYWAIQAALLTPLTSTRHHLCPSDAFTSSVYFLHNGRWWWWIHRVYSDADDNDCIYIALFSALEQPHCVHMWVYMSD